jgi:hypothetical protein
MDLRYAVRVLDCFFYDGVKVCCEGGGAPSRPHRPATLNEMGMTGALPAGLGRPQGQRRRHPPSDRSVHVCARALLQPRLTDGRTCTR